MFLTDRLASCHLAFTGRQRIRVKGALLVTEVLNVRKKQQREVVIIVSAKPAGQVVITSLIKVP